MNSIHHYGTFDVDNYGDLLFPKIIEWRLRDYEIQHISPTKGKSCFSDSSYSSNLSTKEPIATFTGGGNIFRFNRTPLDIYSKCSGSAYPSLVIDPCISARTKGVPYIINSPSIAKREMTLFEKIVFSRVIATADYISFRDQKSMDFTSRITKKSIHLVPDTAFDISRMWPHLKSDQNHVSPYAVFHVNSRYGGAPEKVADAIKDFISSSGLKVVFLPIGPCHGDYDYAKKISSLVGHEAEIFDDFKLKGFAEKIANSALYVGSSMHGFITAASYGVPCGLVLKKGYMNKFEGVLEALEMGDNVIVHSWNDIIPLAKAVAPPDKKALSDIFDRLDKHWRNIEICLSSSTKSEELSFPLEHFLIKISQIITRAEKFTRKLYKIMRIHR
ncbi:polysaccharide pyruvyl transferase family protein [Sulfitobacter sp. M22]|uniref:polysaccharide pyruvyl transferase family protein n=1 Tax=Sulfitobacter sp. M22 TaxID=2675332 RepID=UPI001F1BCC7B|nr:polysaccharide pyruvyl transferase family protein [Sulfitobacter sp. M22]MCF7728056.1 hypothetical protein [Sulfitobacter sp. M22]